MEKIIIQIQKEICSHYYCSISVSTYHLQRHYNIRPDSHCSYDLQLGLKAFPGLAREIMIKKNSAHTHQVKFQQPVSRSTLVAWSLRFPISWPTDVITIGHVALPIASPILQYRTMWEAIA